MALIILFIVLIGVVVLSLSWAVFKVLPWGSTLVLSGLLLLVGIGVMLFINNSNINAQVFTHTLPVTL